ncbi:ABC transporter substrate-binding protein [Ichthyenterobacterium magnum]|uniref:ABC-type Fe3+-hydroxamate transport system substrate-binding protein n=1 Tax=Ichthyenterobacterium magnum TaxID=1230530 RepID=A0A420DET4_9FLAO|nr:helical backbone metal receptor [Ichthyenterobacterium magnum]RKE90814.1 ABC-type Fe3+-hydroxamate transport system substrate-binding protein [Ichthyenterobacterium magnum]
MKFRDQLNRTIHLKSVPKRIVSLVPSQTELLCDLGLESSIIGVTKFCVHPHYIKTKVAVVGGTKQVNFDKIKALDPDIILCNKEENTLEMIIRLEQIAPVHISDIYTIDDCLELIKMYGELFLKKMEAETIAEKIQTKHLEFKTFIEKKPIKKVVYFIWKNPWMVAASHTFINEMLRLNKFENSYKNLERYPEVQLDEIKKNTDLVLLSSEPYPFKEEHISELKTHLKTPKIQLVDGEMFSWYGSRLTKAFNYFKTLH